jgi:hypothetical protein
MDGDGSMWNTLLIWMVPTAIALHNVEEALWLPAWSRTIAGRWHRPVSASAFRFAVIILTTLAVAIAILAQLGGYGSLGYYLLASYALGQSINIIVPHFVATIATRTYAPGLASGIFFVLPASAVFLIDVFLSPDFNLRRFLIVSVVFIPLVVLSIPVLLWAGQMIEKKGIHTPANKPDAGESK